MGVLWVKQISKFLCTYSADVFGVCSALYELGGLVIMHDASGCNSTYTTHDEPRWYTMESLVYVSALTETEAIMGDDNKLIKDIIAVADEMSPRFIAIAGTPIPMMMGTDFTGIAHIIEKRTGIPTFGFETNG
ncbi:MAG: nitrogenase component 1, partial [Oscillospiraceae bacterium]